MAPKQTVPARRSSRLAAAGTGAVVLTLTLAGCGGGNNTASAPQTTTASAATTTAPETTSATAATPETYNPPATSSTGGQGTKVTVTEVDFKIQLSTTAFKPGTYTFVVKNAGQATHALEIEGPGIEEHKTPTISSGGSTMLTVTLPKGSYEVYCPVD